MTTYIGKIGRLSKDCRNELGRRIEDGVPGTEIVSWLNGRPEVQRIMEEQFGGRVITEQNLSEWRKAGHVDWLRRQEAKEAAVRLVEEADDLEEATEAMSLSDRFGIVLAAEMTRLAAKLLEAEADPEKRWRRLCEINRELSQLRRDDHRAVRESIRQERWRREQEREEEEIAAREAQEAKRRQINLALSPAWNHEVAKMFGGGEAGREVAERLHGIRFDVPSTAQSGKRESGKAETFNPLGKSENRSLRTAISGKAGRSSACQPQSKKPMKADESKGIQANRGSEKLNNEVTKEQGSLQAAAEEGQGGACDPEVRNPKSEIRSPKKPAKAGESRLIQGMPWRKWRRSWKRTWPGKQSGGQKNQMTNEPNLGLA